MDAIRENIPLLLQGIGTTVALTVLGYVFALVVGTAIQVRTEDAESISGPEDLTGKKVVTQARSEEHNV